MRDFDHHRAGIEPSRRGVVASRWRVNWGVGALVHLALCLLPGLVVAGCQEFQGDEVLRDRARTESAEREAVAVVNGQAIGIRDVRAAVRATGLPPRDVLKRLEARELLLQEAARRHVQVKFDERRVRQALVQALLISDVEGQVVPEAAVREAFNKQAERFSTPERRASVHVLAVVKPGDDRATREAAYAFIEEMIPLLRVEEFSKVAQRAKELGAGQRFEVKAEKVPAVSVDGNLVRPYMDALFSLSAPGVVPEPVETRFGFHAVYVTDIQPATSKAYADVRDMLREEITLARRKTAADELLRAIAERTQTKIHDDALPDLAKVEP